MNGDPTQEPDSLRTARLRLCAFASEHVAFVYRSASDGEFGRYLNFNGPASEGVADLGFELAP